jgi:hypothetical protein
LIEDVLVAAIRDGLGRLTWQSETSSAMLCPDEQKQQYKGLTGQSVRVLVDGKSLLVKPDVAQKQIESEKPEVPKERTEDITKPPGEKEKPEHVSTEEKRYPRRFYGSVKLDTTRLGRDAGKIAEEVVQHLSTLVGSKVEVTLEINAHIPDGAPDNVVRTVTENCKTLRFGSHGFEEE